MSRASSASSASRTSSASSASRTSRASSASRTSRASEWRADGVQMASSIGRWPRAADRAWGAHPLFVQLRSLTLRAVDRQFDAVAVGGQPHPYPAPPTTPPVPVQPAGRLVARGARALLPRGPAQGRQGERRRPSCPRPCRPGRWTARVLNLQRADAVIAIDTQRSHGGASAPALSFLCR